MHRIDTPGNVGGLFVPPNPLTGQQAVLVDSPWLNDVQENIVAVIAAAGIALVKGTYTQLRDAINSLIAAAIAAQAIPYCVDTGAANAYVITPAPALGAYAAGVTYRVKFVHLNTGASTIAVSGLAAKAIVRHDGSALEPGDIPANSEGIIVYDGAQFQLTDATALFGGDTGSGGWTGMVPAPAAGDAAAHKLLGAGGGWVARNMAPDVTSVVALSGTLVSAAHGFAAQPSLFTAYIRCVTPELGFTAGQEVQLPGTPYDQYAGGTGNWAGTYVDATAGYFSYEDITRITLFLAAGGVPGTNCQITPANWQVVFRFWK